MRHGYSYSAYIPLNRAYRQSSMQRQILELIEGWLRHKSDMVNLEAARVICEMKGVTAQQLTKPIAGKINYLLWFRISLN